SPEALGALRWLAEADARAVQHDVVRMLSCPSARVARLDGVLDQWLAQGLLPADGSLGFAPLGALDPSALATPLATRLEAAGHRAEASLGGYAGRLAPGFDEALRRGDWVALDWWLARVPGLVDGVPPTRPNQLPWLPLAQVLTPGYLAAPAQQPDLVRYLLAHGADPWRALPHDPARSVVAYAQSLGSPLAPMLASAHPAGTYAARSAPIARLTPVALRLAQ
ncbi:MAG TPA: hypothetical protein VF291_12310, partial [Burkholderiaceae bacterium]